MTRQKKEKTLQLECGESRVLLGKRRKVEYEVLPAIYVRPWKWHVEVMVQRDDDNRCATTFDVTPEQCDALIVALKKARTVARRTERDDRRDWAQADRERSKSRRGKS